MSKTVSMYHVAGATDRAEIKELGLSVEAPYDRNHAWCNRGVYLFDNAGDAATWASSILRDYATPADLWKCEINQDELMADEYREVSAKYASSWMVYEITPECLIRIPIASG